MKAKKALKRLRRVEELLSIVIDEFAGNAPSVRKLLDSAKTSVVRAKAGINSRSASANPKRPQLRVKQTKRLGIAGDERRRISFAIKERSTVAKRTSERKMPVKSEGERDTVKSGFSTPPMPTSAERPLIPEAPPEPSQDRHAN